MSKVIPCTRLEYNVSGVCYVILSTPDDVADWVGSISPTLKFVVKDCDPATGEPDSNEGYVVISRGMVVGELVDHFFQHMGLQFESIHRQIISMFIKKTQKNKIGGECTIV